MARAPSGLLAALVAAIAAIAFYLLVVPLDTDMLAPLSSNILLKARPALLQSSLSSSLLSKPFHSTILPQRNLTANKMSTSTSGAHSTSFLDAVHARRTYYSLEKTSPIPDSRIEEIARIAIKDVPSSFNSQSARMVVLLKDEHDKFWDTTKEILKAIVPEDAWGHTEGRLNGFRAGYGTVRCLSPRLVLHKLTDVQILFYEDPEPIKALQSKFAIYADKFPQWSEHTSAMHQYAMWYVFAAEVSSQSGTHMLTPSLTGPPLKPKVLVPTCSTTTRWWTRRRRRSGTCRRSGS